MSDPMRDFQPLVEAVLDGSATAEERRRFEIDIRDDAALRAEYIEQVRIHALLQWRHGIEPKPTTRPSQESRRPPARRGVRWLLAASAALVAAALIWGMRTSPDIARLDANESAVLIEGSLPEVGRSVPAGVYRLTEGVIRLNFSSGAVVQIQSPAHFEIDTSTRLRLHRGQLTARMDGGKSGFVVDTPNANVVDEGTEFGVEVTPLGQTDIVVFQGKVALTPERRESLPLVQGEAVRVAADGDVSRIVNVSWASPSRLWTTEAIDGPIASVRDTIRGLDSKKYYRIVRRGLAEDAQAYVDRPHEWNGVTPAGLPKRLIGADYVMTFNDDKRKPDIEVTVTLAKPCRLLVFFDDRIRSSREALPPEWLASQFVLTGEKIGLDEGPSATEAHRTGAGPGTSIERTFSVWELIISQPGEIKLGTNDRRAMYGIAAIPLD